MANQYIFCHVYIMINNVQVVQVNKDSVLFYLELYIIHYTKLVKFLTKKN